MAEGISVTGNKKIKTLQKEFTEKFPYLSLSLFPLSEKGKKTQKPYKGDLTISEVRSKKNPGNISVHGRTLVGNLEKKFEEVFGLYAQVCYTNSDGNRYFTSEGHGDESSLAQLNRTGDLEGWKKGLSS